MCAGCQAGRQLQHQNANCKTSRFQTTSTPIPRKNYGTFLLQTEHHLMSHSNAEEHCSTLQSQVRGRVLQGGCTASWLLTAVPCPPECTPLYPGRSLPWSVTGILSGSVPPPYLWGQGLWTFCQSTSRLMQCLLYCTHQWEKCSGVLHAPKCSVFSSVQSVEELGRRLSPFLGTAKAIQTVHCIHTQFSTVLCSTML